MSVTVVEPNVVCLQAPTIRSKERLSAKAAKFCTSPNSITEILNNDSDDDKVLSRVLDYGHFSVLEMDWWVFGVENVSRTLTHQLVRKRVASYAQESMRYASQSGEYKIIVPKTLKDKTANIKITDHKGMPYDLKISLEDLAEISHKFYEQMQEQGVPNEDARYGLLEASKTKIMIGMNSHALLDFFAERTCSTAQWEIRNMANEMLRICREFDPLVFENAGPKCQRLGYCPESKVKWEQCKRKPRRNQ